MERVGKSGIMDKITAPLTPRKTKKIEDINLKIKMVVEKLSYHWCLCLEPPPEADSPLKRSEKPQTIEQEVVFKIKVLCFKELIDPLIQQFETEAKVMYSGWVHKPKAERGVVPERTRHSRISVTEKERANLLQYLLNILTEAYNATMTPKKQQLATGNPNTSIGAQQRPRLDDSAIPFSVSKSIGESKRPREYFNEDTIFKKPRLPEQTGVSFSRRESWQPSARVSRSAQTSFASEASSVFSDPKSNISNKSLPDLFTQETFPTQSSAPEELGYDTRLYRNQMNTSFEEKTQSSEYEGGSSFDAALAELESKLVGIGQQDPVIDEELSQDMIDHAAIADENVQEYDGVEELVLGEGELRDSLRGVFRKYNF